VVELIITADDYGYHPSYDAGILEAAEAGAVDAVSAFSSRPGLDPEPLLRSGVEVGLHLDLGEPWDAAPAGEEERFEARRELERQLAAFESAFHRSPAFVDGHHHCHAREGIADLVAAEAAARRLSVRSVTPPQRGLLRRHGIATPDLTIGRTNERRPPLPPELRAGADSLPPVVEWFVHPGHAVGDGFSGYDAGREQDLKLLLGWRPPARVRRRTHELALASKRRKLARHG
jgi:predicted glycoside hydrolase/deacetylase ChbG (UPF0249 family)